MKRKYKYFASLLSILMLINVVLEIGLNASVSTATDTIGLNSGISYYIMNSATTRLMYSDTTNTSDYASVSTQMTTNPTYGWSSNGSKWNLDLLAN